MVHTALQNVRLTASLKGFAYITKIQRPSGVPTGRGVADYYVYLSRHLDHRCYSGLKHLTISLPYLHQAPSESQYRPNISVPQLHTLHLVEASGDHYSQSAGELGIGETGERDWIEEEDEMDVEEEDEESETDADEQEHEMGSDDNKYRILRQISRSAKALHTLIISGMSYRPGPEPIRVSTLPLALIYTIRPVASVWKPLSRKYVARDPILP
jgi:hypothetical protein